MNLVVFLSKISFYLYISLLVCAMFMSWINFFSSRKELFDIFIKLKHAEQP